MPFPTDGGASQVVLCLSSERAQLREKRPFSSTRRFLVRESLVEVLLTNAFGRLRPFPVFTAYLFCSLHGEVKSTLYTNCFSVPVGGWVRLKVGVQRQRGRRTPISSSLWKNIRMFSRIATRNNSQDLTSTLAVLRTLRSLAGRLGSPPGFPHPDSHFLESCPPQEQELGLASNRWTQRKWCDDVTAFNTATRMEVWSPHTLMQHSAGGPSSRETLCPTDLEGKLACLWASKEGGGPQGRGHRAASRGQPAGTKTLGSVAAKLRNLPQITESLSARFFPCPASDDTAACLLLHQTWTHSNSWPTLVCGFKLLVA